MIYNRVLLITLIIIVIYTLIIMLTMNKDTTEEQQESKEEREKAYLVLQNMTSQEILLFKDKNDFIKTIKQYDMIKYFLKGTEEENIQQLIDWYYPNYKRLD